jgi:hypothetical protein
LALSVATAVGACGSGGSTMNTGNPDSGGGGDGGDGAVAASLGFTPSNIPLGLLDLTGLGDVDITGSGCGFNSEMNDVCVGLDSTLLKFAVITQPNQIKVGVYAAHSWRIEPNASVTVFGNFPIVFLATDSIDILGGISATANGDATSGGGYRQTMSATKGAGPGGGGAGGAMGAGGGGSYCGIGGNGGAMGGSGGMGGAAYGTPQIVPLEGGSQGGGGSSSDGGAGGGAIQLVAANSVSIGMGASVNVGGGHGSSPGGGGGSGGVVLIEAKTVSVAGTIAANGGGGVGGASPSPAMDGQAGTTPAAGTGAFSGAAAGGAGSAGATLTGANGGDGTAMPIFFAGGGGGGAGRIRINTQSGSATLTGATLSPDATTPCVTQGTLAL